MVIISQTMADYLENEEKRGKKPNEGKKNLQGPKKWFAKCDKHYPSRSGQTSLATAVANFTKPRTNHFFDLCSPFRRARLT